MRAADHPDPNAAPHDVPSRDACAALVLAAGRGQRMGSPKALVPFDGVPLVLAVAHRYLTAGVRRCLLVVTQPVRAALAEPAGRLGVEAGIEWILSADVGAPMIDSVRLGLERARALGPLPVFVQPVDAGPPSPAVLDALRGAVPGRLAAKPMHGGRGGHPVLLTAAAAEDIRSGHASTLREAMAAWGEQQIARIEVADASVLTNWNRPQDLPPPARTG